MKVTYISHSGFLLDVSNAYFLFDYFEGDIPEMNREYPLVVFVSHKHADHYNPAIFELVKQYPNVHYVVSRDVPVKWKIQEYKQQGIFLEDKVTVVRKNTDTELALPGQKETLKITTLKSTDEGVAYLLTYREKKYYHAGDLNLWLWAGESKQYNDNMRIKYFRELEKLKGIRLEAAFLPLDPRQEQDAFGGMESFLEYVRVRKVFPMHFWGDYSVIEDFLRKHPEYAKQVVKIGKSGQTVDVT